MDLNSCTKSHREACISSIPQERKDSVSRERLAAARSRSRENNTQLFSSTLAPLRYALGLPRL